MSDFEGDRPRSRADPVPEIGFSRFLVEHQTTYKGDIAELTQQIKAGNL